MSVEEYNQGLQKLLIKCDLQEPKNQTIARDHSGLNRGYSHVIDL